MSIQALKRYSKNKIMLKNIVVYYLAILLPVPLLIWVSKSGYSGWFVALIFIYALPYRTLIDGVRLVNKKIIKLREIWKLLVPWQRFEYTKELYFRK